MATAIAASWRSTRVFGTYPSNPVQMVTGTPAASSAAALPVNECSVSMLLAGPLHRRVNDHRHARLLQLVGHAVALGASAMTGFSLNSAAIRSAV